MQKISSLPPLQRIWMFKGTKYELFPEKDFWLGKYRAMYKGDSLKNLKLIKNVVNVGFCK